MIRNKASQLFKERMDWFLAIALNFIRLKPKCIFSIVLISITLQVLGLASFLLPLKMIFMLGMDSFTPIDLSVYVIKSKNQLAIIFVISISLIILLTLGLEKYVKVLSASCLKSILNLTKKLQVIKNEQQASKDIYNKVITSISSFVFTFVISTILIYIHPVAYIVTVVYWITAIIIIMVLFNRNSQFKLAIEKELTKVLNHFGTLVFLLVFIYVIMDFLSDKPNLSVIYAFVFLILLRHMNSSIISFAQNVHMLYKRKEQLNAVFFKKNPKKIFLKTNTIKFWQLFEKDYYEQWIPNVLNSVLQRNLTLSYCEIYELNLSDVACFELTVEKNGSEQKEKFLLKMFNKKKKLQALQQEELYKASNIANLSIDFIGSDKVDEYYCHLFKFDNIKPVLKKDFRSKKLEIFNIVSSFELPSVLTEQYKNTHKFIYERLTDEMLIPIKLTAGKIDGELIYWFEKNIESISHKISTLPLRLVFPVILESTVATENNEVKLLSIQNWSIEPIGYGIDDDPKEKDIIKTILGKKDYDLACIVQCMKLLEKNYNQYRFEKAIECIRTIQNIYKNQS